MEQPEPFILTDQEMHTKAKGNFLSQVLLCFSLQMTLCALLTYEMFTPTGDNPIAQYPGSGVVVARFVCGVVLHMMLQGELISGLNNMKFALNHYYRFENPWMAYLAGFLQAVSIFVIEIVNFFVILTSQSYLEVVMNFMALAIISEFDNAFYISLG